MGSKLNVSRKTISAWENGRAKPDIEYLNTLSTLFNISVDQMIHNTGNNGKYFQKSNHNISLIKGLFFFQFLLFFTEILTLLNTIHILVNTFLLLACSVFIHLYTYYYYFSKSTKKDFLRKKVLFMVVLIINVFAALYTFLPQVLNEGQNYNFIIGGIMGRLLLSLFLAIVVRQLYNGIFVLRR